MIRYTLKCARGHDFDSWFQSSDAYEALRGAGHLACAVCGGGGVEKAIMAPRLSTGAGSESPSGAGAGPDRAPRLSGPPSPAEAALRALRDKLLSDATDVGREFAREARAIHEGDAEPRAIYGQATGEEARALIEDGAPVAPLPFPVRRDS